MQFSGAAVPVAYQCWVLPCVWCFKVHYFLWISQCNPLFPHVQGHTVVWSPSSFHSLKKTQQTNFPSSKKTPPNSSPSPFIYSYWVCGHISDSNHRNSWVYTWTAETPLFGSQIKSNGCLFHCPNKFFINCVRSLQGREKGREEKSCSGM